MFDGHGGMEASAFAAAQLPLAFADFLQTAEEKDPVAAFNHAFHEVDYHFAAKSKSEVRKGVGRGRQEARWRTEERLRWSEELVM